ncbi:hypothetical protein SDC9_204966 [bioreactor metagenome]|uniref:Uncharacterized protein n=1 Tax=bioreactor metagenome TaxID=1076179 RepID=A0A645J2C9_9ZZZZ
MIQVEVRVWQRGLRPLHEDAVDGLIQQIFQYLPLVIDAVSRGGKNGRILVCGKHTLRLAQDAGEDIVADVGCDHRDVSASHRVCLCVHAGPAAALLRDQSRVHEKGKRLTDGLAACGKTLGQLLFGWQHLPGGKLSCFDFVLQFRSDALIFRHKTSLSC